MLKVKKDGEKKCQELDAAEYPEFVENYVTRGFRLRTDSKDLQDRAKEVKDEADELLRAAFAVLPEVKVIEHEGMTVTLAVTKRSKVDMDRVKQYLLEKGVSPIVLKNAFEKGTTVSEYETMTFRQPTTPRRNKDDGRKSE